MFSPLFPVASALQRSSTRSMGCTGALDFFTTERKSIEERTANEESVAQPETTLQRLDAELQSWLNHPSNSTWTGPQKNID